MSQHCFGKRYGQFWENIPTFLKKMLERFKKHKDIFKKDARGFLKT